MPAIDYQKCPPAGRHGDQCWGTNIHRHGKLRWFLAAVRCSCDCHIPERKRTLLIEED